MDRVALLYRFEVELRILWSDMMASLPTAEGAKLGQQTAAGRRFRELVSRVWTRPQTFEVVKQHEAQAGEIASRASLISRVRTQAKPYLIDSTPLAPRERWREIHRAFAAWWRPWMTGEGELHLLLAMRWELPGQVGIDLPPVTDQHSLNAMGERFGVFMLTPPVPAVLSGGKTRLAVLSLDFAEELLEQPMDDPPTDEAEGTVTE